MSMGPVQCRRPQGWVLGCPFLYLLKSWTLPAFPSSPLVTIATLPSREDLGVGMARFGAMLLHLGRGNLVASIPTLAWQLPRSLSPTPAWGCRHSALRLQGTWMQWVGAVALGSPWGEDMPGSACLAQLPWLAGGGTLLWSGISTC